LIGILEHNLLGLLKGCSEYARIIDSENRTHQNSKEIPQHDEGINTVYNNVYDS
jgi:hypothetical protein